MTNLNKKQFVVTVTELDSRLEEQSGMNVAFAVLGTLASGIASASDTCGPFNNEPCRKPIYECCSF